MASHGKRPDPVKRKLDQLAQLRPAAAASALRPYPQDKVNLVVAKAASIAGGLRIAELAPDLAAAFDRLMTDPARLDPGCAATTALVKALLDMEYLAERIYLAGIRHVQMEPSYGGPADAAVELRAASALGLALTAYDCVVFELVRLLTDPEWRARLAAARALACTGLHDVIPVLQHKAAVGDPEPEVTGECLVGLMTLAPGRYVPFVDSFVDHRDPAVREAAILAFGAVRSDLALQALARRWPGLPAALRGPALSALAMMRSDAALDFLINLIESAEEKVAAGAERVLLQHHDSENVRNRIQAARLRRQLLTE